MVLEARVSPENTSKYVDTVTVFAKTWTKGHWPLDDLWPHICWGLMCDSTQGSLCPSPMKIHQSMWIQWPLFAKTWTKGHWPLDVLWPHICWGRMCDSTHGSMCPSPMGIHQCIPMGQVQFQAQCCDQKFPWDRSHGNTSMYSHGTWTHWSMSHGNTSMYVDTVINFANYHTHTTYYILHTTYYILHTTYYILHTTYYVLRTTYRISDHIVSFWTTFRRDNNKYIGAQSFVSMIFISQAQCCDQKYLYNLTCFRRSKRPALTTLFLMPAQMKWNSNISIKCKMYSTFSLSLDRGISRHLPDKKNVHCIICDPDVDHQGFLLSRTFYLPELVIFPLMFGVFIFFCVSCPCAVCLNVVTKKQRNLKYTSSKMHLYNCCSDVTGKEIRKNIEYWHCSKCNYGIDISFNHIKDDRAFMLYKTFSQYMPNELKHTIILLLILLKIY